MGFNSVFKGLILMRNALRSWRDSGLRRKVEQNCALLGYYAASSGNSLPTFRDSVSVLTPENGTDMLSRNTGKELPLLAAW